MNKYFTFHFYKQFTAKFFAFVFQLIAVALLVLSIYGVFSSFKGEYTDLMTSLVTSINTLVIALAMYELGSAVSKEYASIEHDGVDIIDKLRQGITRFVGTVIIALVLESLILVIKFSQLDLMSNIAYAVAIMVGASFMLIALGVFLHLTKQ